jgi:hypothetical protein
MSGKRLSKSKREGLVAGTFQPQNPKEERYVANQLAKREAGGRLPVTREQVEHDQYHASMRRRAQSQRDDAPRNISFHEERSRRAFGEHDYTEREYRSYSLHSRPRERSPLDDPPVSERDDLRYRIPGDRTYDRDPRRDSWDDEWYRQDRSRGRSTAGQSSGHYRDSGYDRMPPPPPWRPEPRSDVYRPDYARYDRKYESRSPPRGRRFDTGDDRFDNFRGRRDEPYAPRRNGMSGGAPKGNVHNTVDRAREEPTITRRDHGSDGERPSNTGKSTTAIVNEEPDVTHRDHDQVGGVSGNAGESPAGTGIEDSNAFQYDPGQGDGPSWNDDQDDYAPYVGAYETSLDDAMITKGHTSGIDDAEDLQSARERAAEEAKQRRAAKIQQKRDRELEKEHTLIEGIDLLTTKRARLERQTITGVNTFAAPLLQLIEHYCAHGDQDEPDIFRRTLRHNGRLLPSLRSVLAIEPRFANDTWASDDLIKFLLDDLLLSGAIPKDQYLITDPVNVHMFANPGTSNEDAARFFNRQIAENDSLHAQDVWGMYLAESMPAGCHSLHFVWNPPNNHWLQSTLVVDKDAGTGRIIVRNSMSHGNKYGASSLRAMHDLPYLARIMSQRPGLDWENILWGPVEHEECAEQNNVNDCGFLACDTARRVVLGEDLYLPEDHDDREAFGRQLRWEALSHIIVWIFGEDLGEMPAEGQAGPEDFEPAEDNESDEEDEARRAAAPQGTLGGTCGPCEADGKSDCDGRHPCANCSEGFCWYNDWTAEVQPGRNIRTLICNRLVAGNGSASIAEIVDHLQEHLDVPEGIDTSHEQLTQRVRTILSCERSSSTFTLEEETPGTPGNEIYGLSGGFGRSVDSDRLYKLCGSSGNRELVGDDLDLEISLVIPCTRVSSGHMKNDGPERMRTRATLLLEAHHARFSRTKDLSPKVDTPDELEACVDAGTRCWMPHTLEPGTSNISYLDDLRKSGHVFAALKRLHDIALRRQERLTVLILFNGDDGLTTENLTWRQLVELFPWLDIRLTMVSPSKCFSVDYGRLDGGPEVKDPLIWVHMEARYLAKIYDADAGLDFHLCRHQDLAKVKPDEDNMMKINCSHCESQHGVFQNDWCWLTEDQECHDVEELQSFFCHAIFIHVLEVIKYLKLDHSIFNDDRRSVAPGNSLARFLTAIQRNAFQLPHITEQECELCHDDVGPFQRGRSSMVALRCAPACQTSPIATPERDQSDDLVPQATLTELDEASEGGSAPLEAPVSQSAIKPSKSLRCGVKGCEGEKFVSLDQRKVHNFKVHGRNTPWSLNATKLSDSADGRRGAGVAGPKKKSGPLIRCPLQGCEGLIFSSKDDRRAHNAGVHDHSTKKSLSPSVVAGFIPKELHKRPGRVLRCPLNGCEKITFALENDRRAHNLAVHGQNTAKSLSASRFLNKEPGQAQRKTRSLGCSIEGCEEFRCDTDADRRAHNVAVHGRDTHLRLLQSYLEKLQAARNRRMARVSKVAHVPTKRSRPTATAESDDAEQPPKKRGHPKKQAVDLTTHQGIATRAKTRGALAKKTMVISDGSDGSEEDSDYEE